MTDYAVLLRGVNVGGVTVRSADLRSTLAALPVSGVKTFLASGNVTLSSEAATDELKSMVEAALRADFGYDAWVVVLTKERLAELAAAVPYPADDAQMHAYVTFGSDAGLLTELFEAGAALGAEQVRLGPEAVAWPCPKGQTLEGPLSRLGPSARYKASTTTRNLRTLQRMIRD
ncbi:DUF1697 domain-containing protein [Arthrobacter sp. zg-Y1219]|uniref:DUF1697 domain-containing protein n=1 Tax=Arthrobacter sp. zg-Y1219 TaxID=3049067 RepID=UPI0024C460C5|nr:DUF1697 domain-containing protein [Arthrobacter sp. zg-Y1219]MDK1359340.1 DUF1697 domain-containing protein [Arthrobacter sp. zg-Y1219]